ncbi:MAG: SurA N-terminal domain-containing protein [Candidatus Omnitrophica bacterium]|nr:SurA N-terminal domain-containing protein [Candidatus Omnitrophota bacterium]
MPKRFHRKETTKRIWIALGILILPAFLFWGIGQIFPSKKSSPKYIGKIANKNVSFEEYKKSIQGVKNLLLLQMPDRELLKSIKLEEQAWQRLILLQEAKKRKIKVNDEEVINFIKEINLFKNRTGQFDQQIYLRLLKSLFHTFPRDFEEGIRENLIISKLFSEATKDVEISEAEIKDEFRKLNEEIEIETIGILFSDLENQISPTEEELKDYFSKNNLNFKLDLSFNLEYVILDNEEKLKEFNEKFKNNKDFLQTAKELNLTIKQTGLFTQSEGIPGLGWIPQVFSQLLKAKEKELLSPLLIDEKYYLLRLKERKEPHIPNFEEIKERVKREFIKDKTRNLAEEKMKLALEKTKQSNLQEIKFQKLAEELSLNYNKLGPFKYGGYLEKIGSTNEFWRATKDLKENEISGLISLPSGIFLARLIKRSVFDENKFNQEKEKLKESILLEKKEDKFQKLLEGLKKHSQLY